MYLAAGLFEQHDRARFEVIAFDNTREDGCAMRRRVLGAFDRCLPIQRLSDSDAAQLIMKENIDILINLNGYFGAQRMGRLCAPAGAGASELPGFFLAAWARPIWITSWPMPK